MNGTSADEGTELLALLRRHRDGCRRLRLLAARQRETLVQDDSPALLRLLGERQRVVDELSGLNERLTPYRLRWTEVYGSFDAETQLAVKVILEEANDLLAAVMAADEADAAALQSRRRMAQLGIAGSGAADRAAAAYAAAKAGPATGASVESSA